MFEHDRVRLRGFKTVPLAMEHGLGQGFAGPLFHRNRVLLAIDDQHSMFIMTLPNSAFIFIAIGA